MTDWIPDDSFGFRLRWIRHEKRLSSRELASLINVSNQAILDWERGASPKNMQDIVLKISEHTDVDPVWLMWGNEVAEEIMERREQLQTI